MPATLFFCVQIVYDMGPVVGLEWDDFDTMRQRVAEEWQALPKVADNISATLKVKIGKQMEARGKKPKF